MRLVDLADTRARDMPGLLGLNTAHKVETSDLSPARLTHLLDRAFLALAAPNAEALLIAFDQDADYDSVNFLWFKFWSSRFVYVDRVIVAPQLRGHGMARHMYERLFDAARMAGHDCITCEVNSDPPNPASDAFHAALGFSGVGLATLGNGKTVRYLSRRL